LSLGRGLTFADNPSNFRAGQPSGKTKNQHLAIGRGKRLDHRTNLLKGLAMDQGLFWRLLGRNIVANLFPGNRWMSSTMEIDQTILSYPEEPGCGRASLRIICMSLLPCLQKDLLC